jgi:hypothetical protein
VKKIIIITAILLIISVYGCGAILSTALVGYSMVSTDPTFRDSPSSQNIWGPTRK